METENLNILSADNPLIDPKDDRLGYASFAKNLAESLCLMTSSEGLVLAVYGSWGSGKSTLLNFVIHNLEQKPNNEQPIIVRFNPWWFSGQEELTRHFFEQLQVNLKKAPNVAKELTENLANFADIVSGLPIPYAEYVKALSDVGKAFVQPKDIYKLKEEIEKILKQQKQKILIVIDDIDRLTAEEIRQLFRVIKAVANFPNVIYLLLFDKEVVIKALEEAQGIPGEDYLEKIVQVPFELPIPDQSSLQGLLFEKLNVILSDTPQELFDQTHWGNVFLEGINEFIAKPRDIIRLTNTLSVTYPAVKGEVDPVDFIAIESLRVFCPKIYNVIRNNPQVFTRKVNNSNTSSNSHTTPEPLLEKWTSQLQEEERETVKKLLERLEDYTKEDISSESIPSIVQAFFIVGDELLRPEDKNLGMFDYGNDMRISRILYQLLSRMNQIERFKLLKEVVEKGKALSIIIRELNFIGTQQGKYGADRAKPKNQWFVSTEQLNELEEIALKKIQNAAKQNTLMYMPNLLSILYFWKKRVIELCQSLQILIASSRLKPIFFDLWFFVILYRTQVKQWVKEVIKSEEGLTNFLEKFLQQTCHHSASNLISTKSYQLNLEGLEHFLGPSSIIDRVNNLLTNNQTELTKEQTKAVEEFIREYEIRQQGKDTNWGY